MHYRLTGILVFFLIFITVDCGAITVDWQTAETIRTAAAPREVKVSADGRYTFILTDDGEVHIYSAEGVLQDTVKAGGPIDSIEVAPAGDRIFLIDSSGKAIRIVDLTYIQEIKTAGAPYKGPADAPVVLAVFSDFE